MIETYTITTCSFSQLAVSTEHIYINKYIQNQLCTGQFESKDKVTKGIRICAVAAEEVVVGVVDVDAVVVVAVFVLQ